MKSLSSSLLIIGALCGCATSDKDIPVPDFNNKIIGGEPGQTIAFIGEKIGLEQIEDHCPKDMICMDVRFNARYRILELLEGEHSGGTIDFAVYDHYGTPRFSKHDRVVLYVAQIGDELYHHKYSYDKLSPLKGGGYAACGDPYHVYEHAEIEKFGREDLTAFDFDPPIKEKVSDYLPNSEDLEDDDQDQIREDFFEYLRRIAPPAYEIKGNNATCRMGVTAQDIVAIRMLYEFTPERERIEKRQRCWRQAGLPESGATLALKKSSGFTACMGEDK